MRSSILPAAALILGATAAPCQPPKAARPAETPPTITIKKPIENLPLREAVDYFGDKHRISITVDSSGVAKGEKPFGDRAIKLGKMTEAPAGFLVECLAQAAGATSRKAGDKFVIEAGKPKDLAGLLAPPSPKARAKAAERMTIDRPIVNLPLHELLDFVSEKHDVTIYLDEVGFERVNKVRSVGGKGILVPVQQATVEALLDSVVGTLGGKVVVREEMILIVPDAKAKS